MVFAQTKNLIPPGTKRAAGATAFTTTHWSWVLAAQEKTLAAAAALEKLCRRYWPPNYAFTRRNGVSREDAQDLTQTLERNKTIRTCKMVSHRHRHRLDSFIDKAKPTPWPTRNLGVFTSSEIWTEVRSLVCGHLTQVNPIWPKLHSGSDEHDSKESSGLGALARRLQH